MLDSSCQHSRMKSKYLHCLLVCFNLTDQNDMQSSGAVADCSETSLEL